MLQVRVKVRFGVLFATGVAGALATAAAVADTDDTAVVGGDAALEEVTVTAQKQSEVVSRVPISISAVTQETLEKEGLKNASDLARTVPGLFFTAGGSNGQSQVSIRGISSTVGASTTGIYIDDTPVAMRNVVAESAAAYPRLFDLDRVEVLRGPQGTLFGAGSEGGTVRFITPSPSLAQFSGFTRGEVDYTSGGDPSYELGAAVGGPIIEGKLGFRASVFGQREGGWIDRYSIFTNQEVEKNDNPSKALVAKLGLLYQVTDNLTFEPSIFHQEYHKNNPDYYFELAGVNRSYSKIDAPSEDRFNILNGTITYAFPALTVKSITSYFDRHYDRTNDYSYFETAAYQGGPYLVMGNESYNYIANQQASSPQQNLTEELRFASVDPDQHRFSFVAGLYFSNQRQISYQILHEPIGVLAYAIAQQSIEDFFGAPDQAYQFLEVQHLQTKERAAFGEASIKILDNLKLTGGLRVSHEDFSFTDLQDGPENAGLHIFSGSHTETPVTPKVNLSYQATADHLLYATAAKGYRIGGANSDLGDNQTCLPSLGNLGLKDNPRTFDSDYVWSYELGDKSKFFDRHLSVAFSAFQVNWSQIQQGVFIASCGLSYVANVGSAVSRGFDLQADWVLAEHFKVSGTAGYDDAHFKTNYFRPGSTTVRLAGAGNELPNTPAWKATISPELDFRAFGDKPAFLRLDYQYIGSYVATPALGVNGYDAGTFQQGSVNILSARVGVNLTQWGFQAHVDNLTNSHDSLSRFHDVPGEPLYRDLVFRPLTVGVSADYHF
jgi:outer membrane receptor protein involved in Fe transport